MTPRISIVLPCYNAATYLQETLDSLSRQTWRDFECIAIDDGSGDATRTILQAHAAQDPRFTIISRENRGLISTLNEGIAAARGEWIARMDADDIAHAERLEMQLAHVEQTGADICGCWIRFFGDRRGEWHLPSDDDAIRAHLIFNVALAHPTVLARTSLLKVHPYDPVNEFAEDYGLWCELALSGAKFANVPQVLLDYRTHAGQISQTRARAMRATGQRVRARYIPAYLPEELKPVAARLIELAEPARLLTEDEFCWLAVLLLRLKAWQPQCASAFGTIWLDALQRTPQAGLRLALLTARLARAFPLPKSEGRRYLRQLARCIAGPRIGGWLKGLR
ncbi:MAG: glycosyltransferase family 2 protein [Formivibrio sp.]|nr:glycosyltransferase family 2 protein [Formivibrio sp.]